MQLEMEFTIKRLMVKWKKIDSNNIGASDV